MKKFRISQKFFIVEKPYLGRDKYKRETIGEMDNEGGVVKITIKRNLSDKGKMQTLCHELTHLFEMAFSRPRNSKMTEKICDDLEIFLVNLWNKYPPFRRGLVDSSFYYRTEKKKK